MQLPTCEKSSILFIVQNQDQAWPLGLWNQGTLDEAGPKFRVPKVSFYLEKVSSKMIIWDL